MLALTLLAVSPLSAYGDAQNDNGYSCNSCRGLSGWFVGLQAGMNAASVKYRISTSTSQTYGKDSSLGGLAGVFAGWGSNFSSYGYAGLQAEGNLVSSKNSGGFSGATSSDNYSSKVNGVWGGALLLGFRPWGGNKTMIYLRLGADIANWKYFQSGSPAATNVNGSTSKTKVAFAPGLGVRSMMYKNMFLNMEYKFTAYGSSRIVSPNGNTSSHKPTMQTFTVGIGWRF